MINQKNYNKLYKLYLFCELYKTHRDFVLAKHLSKSKPLSWNQAEDLSNLCNQLVKINKTIPSDFIKNENDVINDTIDKYLALKDKLVFIRTQIGTYDKNELYKSVKRFYRKKVYMYDMDSYYMSIITGYLAFNNRLITYEDFINNFYFEISLFDGSKKSINIRKIIKISNYILNI